MKLYCSLILLFISLSMSAQKDALAEPYLDKISTELNSGSAISIAFNFLREDLQSGTEIEGSGELLLKGEKYMIDMGEAIIWFDGTKQYSLNLDVEEVYISTPDSENKEFMFTDPITLLRDYKEVFKYRYMGDATIVNLNVKEVQLYPIELGGPYAIIKLFFNAKNNQLKEINIRHKEGILYTLTIDTFKKSVDPGNDFFKFNSTDYPDVEIIELVD